MTSWIEHYFLSVIADPPRPGLLPTFLRGFLSGCAALYDVGLEAYLFAENLGLRRREKLPVSVISIGNLTVGGTGKTPMTQMLCRRLIERGKRVAILSRGHGGKGTDVRVVSDSNGRVLLPAVDAGDEPILLARSLPGIPVIVGKDRRLSGRKALRRWPLDVLILDDGFQFWQLARDLDIVLLDARRPFDNGFPLPRGLLREPKRHLRRAGIVVVTRADALDRAGREALKQQVAELTPSAEVYFASHRAVGFVQLPSPEVLPLDTLRGLPVVALCGIAQPESFLTTLREAAGAEIVQSLTFADHHAYSEANANKAYQTMREHGASALVMTEKDAVKWPAVSGNVTVYALRIEMQVEDETRFLAAVTKHLL